MPSLAKERSRPIRRAAAFVALAALLAVVLPSGTATVLAQTSDEPVKEVGTLPRFPADAVAVLGANIKPTNVGDPAHATGGTLIAIPEARQLWQVYRMGQGGGPTAIAVRDLDTLAIIRTFTITVALDRAANVGHGGDWLHALDGTRRIFLVGLNQSRGIRIVIEVDLQTFAQRTIDLGPPSGVPQAGVSTQNAAVTNTFFPGAMEYDPYDDALLMLFGGPNNGISPLSFVHRVDLKTGAQKTRQLRTCSGPLPSLNASTGQLGSIITRDYVYFPCHRQGNIGAVVKIRRSELFGSDATGMTAISDEEFVAGPGYVETAFADPAAGRIFLVTLSAEIWAYDIATSSFVGVVAGGVEGQTRVDTGFGFDRQTGRLFLQSGRVGLGIAEGRFYPIPQARTFPKYTTTGQERIISDPKTNRIFVLTGVILNRAPAYRILDVGPAPVPPPPPDPDRNTIDLEERPGVTEARYFASGTGYGVRTLLAKGIAATPPAPAIGTSSPTGQALAQNINSKCGFTDRELAVGRVSTAEYDTGSSAAQAVGVDVDERTKLDLANPSRCDVTATSGGSGFTGIFSTEPVGEKLRDVESDEETPKPLAWTREPAFCSSSSGDKSRVEDDSKNEGNSKAHVVCPLPGDTLVATATGYLTGAVSVGRAETNTEIRRLDTAVVSRVVSEAQDVDIAGAIQIGRITSVAESKSNGRPNDKPMSTHTITVHGVQIGKTVVCTNNCEMETVLRTLNTAAAGRAEFRSASGRDDNLMRGTPKGASTAVQKSVARQTSDQALTGDRSTELPALEMIVYNDNPRFGRARQVFQFAGVAAAATYNIALLPTGAGFDDDPFDGGSDFEDAFDPGGAELDDLLPSVDVLPPNTDVAAFDDDGAAGSIIERAVQAVARGIRLFFSNPRHMLLLLTAWMLFSLPGVLARRRRLLVTARSD